MDEGNEKVIFGLSSKDMEVLQNLVNEKVDYIETILDKFIKTITI